jgi:hypothetical protein
VRQRIPAHHAVGVFGAVKVQQLQVHEALLVSPSGLIVASLSLKLKAGLNTETTIVA